MRGPDSRPLPALLHGEVLAHMLPQVLLLPGPAGRDWDHLLQQGWHDPLQKRLHQVRPGSTVVMGDVVELLCALRIKDEHEPFSLLGGTY